MMTTKFLIHLRVYCIIKELPYRGYCPRLFHPKFFPPLINTSGNTFVELLDMLYDKKDN